MPRQRRIHSKSSNQHTASPYSRVPKTVEQSETHSQLVSAEDVDEWQETSCPFCFEPPHSAILLICSSHEKGCRPYICNTSSLHSNCLDKFRNTAVSDSKLFCPLCRGKISGWEVIEPARKFFNSKSRSCSCETCDFSGTYSELRKHARSEHPSVRPPKCRCQWVRWEPQRVLQAIVRTVQSVSGDNRTVNGLSRHLNFIEQAVSENNTGPGDHV